MKLYLIILIFLLASCDISLSTDTTFKLKLNDTSFSVLDTIKAELHIKNETSSNVTFQFSTGCNFVIELQNGENYFYGHNRSCTQILTAITVKPNETRVLIDVIPLNTIKNIHDNLGEITLHGFLDDDNSPKLTKKVSITK